MRDCDRQGRVVRNENYVIYRVVIEFISSATVMGGGGPTITDGKSRADRIEDLQVGWRIRVDVCYLCRAVAVTSPQGLEGSHHDAVGSWAVCRGSTTPTRQSPSHTSNAAHPDIVFAINDVHATVRA